MTSSPTDFPSTLTLERTLPAYFAELKRHPKPIQWTDTKTQLLAQFGAPHHCHSLRNCDARDKAFLFLNMTV